MESGMLKAYDEREYSASVPLEAYSSEGSSYLQTSPDYDSKCSSNGNDEDCRWSNVKNMRLMNTSLKEELTELESEDGADRSSCDEDEGVCNDLEGNHENTFIADEEQVDIDSDDYDIEYEYPGEITSENGDVIHVFTVDPDQELEYTSDEDIETNNVQDWCVENFKEPNVEGITEVPPENEEEEGEMEEVDNSEENNILEDITENPLSEHSIIERRIDDKEFSIDKSLEGEVNVDDFFVKAKPKVPEPNELVNKKQPTLIEGDLHVSTTSIDDFTKFFETTPTKSSKSFQKSLSLPHSPSHLPKDDGGRTSLSFEDLNIHVFSDFSFDVDKSTKIFDIMELGDDSDEIRTLNDEDVNSFLITEPKVKVLENEKKPNELQELPVKSDEKLIKMEDDLSIQDMEIECPVETKIIDSTVNKIVDKVELPKASTPVLQIKPSKFQLNAEKTETVLSLCIEKSKLEAPVVMMKNEIKVEQDDFVDVESLNDSIELPVLEANNVRSLLEQFEATEKFNEPSKITTKKIELPLSKEITAKSLVNGVRLQEAAIQLNKNKMRQILMPTSSPNRAAVQKSMQDHDYCSPNKRPAAPVSNFPPKRRQSLLKPEVVTSNHIIKSTRHRSCKSKKIVYTLSSDEEDNIAKHQSDKKDIKNSLIFNHRKKLSQESDTDTQSEKPRRSEIELAPVISSASDCKLSSPNSQSSSGSIKLTIKNKTKVILKLDCDENKKEQILTQNNKPKTLKTELVNQHSIKPLSENSLLKSFNKIEPQKLSSASTRLLKPKVEPVVVRKEICPVDVSRGLIKPKVESVVKKEICPAEVRRGLIKPEVEPLVAKKRIFPEDDFIPKPYYRNRDPLGLMTSIETEQNECKPQLEPTPEITPEVKQPQKKKLNLQEYKLRKEGNSNNSSRTVSPDIASIANQDIFYIHPITAKDKLTPPQKSPSIMHSTPTSANASIKSSPKDEIEEPKIFDPIREASRKILMQTKKQKAEAVRKRDEEIVMRKIPKVENIELKPLMSDIEIMNIVTLAREELTKINTQEPPKASEYEEIIMVSIGINTEDKMFAEIVSNDEKSIPTKTGIHFTIKKPEQNTVLKQNVFDTKKQVLDKHSRRSKTPHRENRTESRTQTDKELSGKDMKIDKERFKDITATLKSVENNSDVKISSNSLFASIQDVVMKKAPETPKPERKDKIEEKKRVQSEESKEPVRQNHKRIKTTIVNQCSSEDHGEDKVILHLPKVRAKPESITVNIQTDPVNIFDKSMSETILSAPKQNNLDHKSNKLDPKSNQNPVETYNTIKVEKKTIENNGNKTAIKNQSSNRSISREDRDKYRRSGEHKRSPKRSPRKSYSRSRSRSRYRSRSYDRRSRQRYSSYKRRSRSPYRSAHSRSPSFRKRSDHRSPSYKKSEHKTHRSRSRQSLPSRSSKRPSRSPVKKVKTPEKATTPIDKPCKTLDPAKDNGVDNLKCASPSKTPPQRKPTLSESSDSSSSSSWSGSSATSQYSHSVHTPSPARFSDSSDDRQCIPPVEERRIVYVGKLEADITKTSLRATFSRFGPIAEVTLHTKDNGGRYGFVTFRRGRDAWSAVESARTRLSKYDVGFGGRRAFCRQRYADLDGLEAEYRESDYLGMPPQVHQTEDISFEVLLQETKKKLSKMKTKSKETVV